MLNKFDLQLFSEGGESAEFEGQTTGATPTDSGKEPGAEKVGLNKDGQVRIFREKADPQQGGEGTPPEQTQYIPEEVRTTDFEKLDPAKIPPEMLPWYKSMQAGFTRKTQEVARQKQEVDEQANAIREWLTEQARRDERTPERAEAANPQKEYMGRIADAAKNQVAQSLGEDFDEFNPAHHAALTFSMQQIYADIAQEAGRQQTLVNLENELRSQGSDYDEVYEYAKAKVADLPYKEYVKLQQAFATGDVRTLKAYYEASRKNFYAEKQGIRTGEQRLSAPRVEGAGSGDSAPKGAPDFAEFGRLKSFDDKLAWMRKNNIKP